MEKAGLKAKLNDDLREAMRSGNTVKRDTIRFLLADIKNTEITRRARTCSPSTSETLDDAGILGVIGREVRQRDESISAFKAGHRPDLVAKEEAELAVIKGYLPVQATHEEIVATVERIIGEVGAKGSGDKGKVIPKVIAELRGKAGGQEINAVVTELLSSKK